MLLPLPEPRLLHLDLLGKPLAKELLLLFELGVVKLLNLGLTKLAGFHLRLSVRLVVSVLGRGNEVKHVGANKERAELAEVAVVLVVD